ncbi:kinase-like domain-containing protein [Dichotomopilus funicola]|uniref:Kinase-like domain-containing protein n=1 Tax=Dichotomopilus funicola TaxID=1934379 RepID=A0AAN6V1Z4_9PEZI|nr:kinase-like domain-containing protein [Dichotomopilus funicola]
MSSPPEREYISSLEALYGGKTSSEWWRDAVADLEKAQAAKAAAPAKKQHGYRDVVVRARIHRERDVIVESIKEEDIRRLASSYHGNDSCVLFKPLIRGSFNVCYFVEFANGDRWVVRVPLRPILAIDPADKLETEVAVMRLLAAKATIPIPKVHFAALGDGPAPFPSFLILEYIDGQKLDYKQFRGLALRRLEFPAIGRLVKDGETTKVGKGIFTTDINIQHLENSAPFDVIQSHSGPGNPPLYSANEYAELLLDLAHNGFLKSRSAIETEAQAEEFLYHLHVFREHAHGWLDRSLDQGPFVLIHGDLEIFNLVLDDDMNVVSVLDWEWSRVVPVQLVYPPLWLNTMHFKTLCLGSQYYEYIQVFDEFLAILRTQEKEKFGNELLADEWTERKKDSGFIVAQAMEYWTAMDWFAYRCIGIKAPGRLRGLRGRVDAFIQEDPARKEPVTKAVDVKAYQAELEKEGMS